MDTPFVDIHTHRNEMRPNVVAIRSIRLGKECIPTSSEPFSAGIHPWDCETVSSEWLDSLETLPVAAVGEIGLDFCKPIDRTLQLQRLTEPLPRNDACRSYCTVSKPTKSFSP